MLHCKIQQFKIFFILGITPSNEIRDPPKYIRYVSSEPLDEKTFYEQYNEEFCDDDYSDTKCFKVWTSTKKKISKSKQSIPCAAGNRRSPPPPALVPVPVR